MNLLLLVVLITLGYYLTESVLVAKVHSPECVEGEFLARTLNEDA
jgi:hypothetical protein